MKSLDYESLLRDLKDTLVSHPHAMWAILGHTPVTYDLLAFFRSAGIDSRLLGVYSPGDSRSSTQYKSLEDLAVDCPDALIVASDAEKEALLIQAAPFLPINCKVVLGGYSHFDFRDAVFDDVVRNTMVPSLANGYPHTLIHIYQCLKNAARLGLNGIVAEFGIFKGGTTMLLARLIARLGQKWKVLGFDTFSGFPPKRSVLDMYAHPDCVFMDEISVRQYLQGHNIEIVAGDIVQTATRLANEDVILAFVDTDNYTSATAILDTIQDRTVVGGAIVFDHFAGRNRFRYTLGERIAARRLLEDPRYFNLHDTGVFLRQ
jgi:hypothetical protein